MNCENIYDETCTICDECNHCWHKIFEGTCSGYEKPCYKCLYCYESEDGE